MIINTGMRTDIPAFYSQWLVNRLKAGYVLVRNPYNESQVTRYRLSPDVVDLIGFCTKNPGPMLPNMDILKEYGQYWFVTITPYGKDIEPHVPPVDQVISDFQKLAEIVGVDSMGWRYDPILLSDTYTMDFHLHAFARMARKLSGYTKTCVISFVDLYPKVIHKFPEARRVAPVGRLALGRALIEIANSYGMTVKPCAEGEDLAPYGADCRGCMTVETFEKALHCRLHVPKRKGVRKECACYLSCDIGAYNSCPHLCRYCYANESAALVQRNFHLHDPASPFLIGGPRPGDTIHEARQESWKERERNLFSGLYE